MKFSRQLRYYYLRFLRLRGEPQELALGICIGVFAGLLPILPFQTAFAVFLALLFKASKITAALGTWISNPLNWYFLYLYSFKLGAWILRLPPNMSLFNSVIEAIKNKEGFLVIASKMLGTGGAYGAAFLLGGLILGIVFSPLFYLPSLALFRRIKLWKISRRGISCDI